MLNYAKIKKENIMDQLLIYLGFAFLIWAIYSAVKWGSNKRKNIVSYKKHGKNTLIGLAVFVGTN